MLFRLRKLPRIALAKLARAIPTSCAMCGSNHEEALCDSCRSRYFSTTPMRCRRCAIPLASHAISVREVCGQCLQNPPAFDATVVASDYAPPVDQLVLALKFGNRLEMASLLARMLHDATVSAGVEHPSVLTAVPLGTRRLAERGFNQSLEIARPFARSLGVPLDAKLLARQRETRAQALLHPDDRHKNMRDAFLVAGKAIERVRNCHVGVVDDVMTTGETLNEVAATLKRFGASSVTNFVFARTSQH